MLQTKTRFAYAYSLSKATIYNMKQNTAIAVSNVFILLAGVLAGTVHLAPDMFIHETNVLIVILNSMRFIRFNHKKIKEDERKLEIKTA